MGIATTIQNNHGHHTTQVGSDAHFELARQVAKESMVLLKNTKQRLPLSKNDFSGSSQLGLLGNSANDSILLMGNYHGDPSRPVVTPLSAFQSLLGETRVNYDQGVWVTGEGSWDFTQAIQVRLDISLAAFFNRFFQTCCFCQRNSSQILTPFLPCTLYILRPSIDD
jgi:beta-glucosidase-like glycosyl hydrolase